MCANGFRNKYHKEREGHKGENITGSYKIQAAVERHDHLHPKGYSILRWMWTEGEMKGKQNFVDLYSKKITKYIKRVTKIQNVGNTKKTFNFESLRRMRIFFSVRVFFYLSHAGMTFSNFFQGIFLHLHLTKLILGLLTFFWSWDFWFLTSRLLIGQALMTQQFDISYTILSQLFSLYKMSLLLTTFPGFNNYHLVMVF